MYHGDEHGDADARETADAGKTAGAGKTKTADEIPGPGSGSGPGRTAQPRPVEALIDLSAIAHNTRVLKDHTNGHLMAVVKGDGFGHGAVEVAQTTLANGATWLGVAHITEALALRAAGLTAPTFAWMHPSDDDVTDALREDIDLSASSLAHLKAIAACAERMGILAAVHLKVDTGLHRNGATLAEWPALTEAAAQFVAQGQIRIRGVWSHLAFSDDPTHPTTGRQIELFDTAVHQAESAGLKPDLLHLANSSAALTVPRTRYDMVRAGIALYGVEPVPGQTFGLRPAMTLRATVIATQDVPAGEDEGENVPFGHPHTTDHPGRPTRPTRVALLPLGYMSGLPRAASKKAQIWLAGARRPIAGLIDMDQCVVEAKADADADAHAHANSAQIAVDDDAIFFGPGTNGEPTAAEWAHWANTNAQQVLTGLGLKVPRRYVPDTTLHPTPDASPTPRKPRITVLFNAPSASAASIVTHLDRTRYTVRPVRITPDGQWIPGPANLPEGHYTPHDLAQLTAPTVGSTRPTPGITHQPTDILRTSDLVIPALHALPRPSSAQNGANGTLQALMDTLNVPYIGSGMAASALATDKDATKRIVQTTGIPVPAWTVLHHEKEALPDEDRTRLGLPVQIKPARSNPAPGPGPGPETTRITTWTDLEPALTAAHTWDTKVLIEQDIAGPQVNVAVLEHPNGRLQAALGQHPDVDTQLTADLQRLAIQIFTALGCSGLAQISFLLRGGTEPIFNEINTSPDFAPTSSYPQTWQTTGLPLSNLLTHLINTALRA